mgnify:CR=1 FL=1
MSEDNLVYPKKNKTDYPLSSFLKYNKCLSAFSGRALFFSIIIPLIVPTSLGVRMLVLLVFTKVSKLFTNA